MKEAKKRGLSTRRRRSESLGSGVAVGGMVEGLAEAFAVRCVIEAGSLIF